MYTVLVKSCSFQQGFRNIYFTNTISLSVPLKFKFVVEDTWLFPHIHFSFNYFSLLVGLNGAVSGEASLLLGVDVSMYLYPDVLYLA